MNYTQLIHKSHIYVPGFFRLRNEIRCPFRNPPQQKVTRVIITNTELCFHKALKNKRGLSLTVQFTREGQVCHDGVLPFLCVAHEGDVNVHQKEEHTCQEANHPDADSVVACGVILVEDALCLWAVGSVDVAFCCDAGKHHHGKQLHQNRRREGEEKRIMANTTAYIKSPFNISRLISQNLERLRV